MFRPLSLSIGLRYTRAKKSSYFISFVAVTSMLGIALGVMVLITVLSVMNGFDEEIRDRFFAMAPQVTLSGQIKDWSGLIAQSKAEPAVQKGAPFVGGQALVIANGFNIPIALSGIDPVFERGVSRLGDLMVEGSLDALQPKAFNLVIGEGVAAKLAVRVGDKVTLMIPKGSVSIIGVQPRFKRFTVAGVFSAGSGFGFDSQLIFLNMHDAQKLYGMGAQVSGVKLKLDDVYHAPEVAFKLMQRLPETVDVSDWSTQFGAFFKAIKLEKNMMFLILMLIVAVAAFNLVSSLVMLVNDKQSDIAILRTMGATPRLVMGIFFVQGSTVGVLGTVVGIVSGILLAWNVTAIVNALQQMLGVQFLSSSVYFVDYLPSKIIWSDVIAVGLLALMLSFLATLYPAWKASRIKPVEALRYE